MENAGRPVELAIGGTHDRVLRLIEEIAPVTSARTVLDIGAGEGALSVRMQERGYEVAACDVRPDLFRPTELECRPIEGDGRLPFDDASFDLAVAVEVMEHLESHARMFDEVHRILRPGGYFLFTTPNILSFKSRLNFLLTGYFYSFGPLDPGEYDPVSQHVTPATVDRYRFLLGRSGMAVRDIRWDKAQRSSMGWYWLAPLVRGISALRYKGRRGELAAAENSRVALLGRKIVMVAQRPAESRASP
jgi:SAM-dependent methyltransferase